MGELKKLAYVFYKYDNKIVFTPRFKFRVLVDLLKMLVEHDIQVIGQWIEFEIEEIRIKKEHVPPKV